MKRKIIAAILTAFTLIGLVGCGNSGTDSNSQETAAQETSEQATAEQETNADSNPNERTKDDVKFTLESAVKEPVKGDRTQDNVRQENGEYFANGSDTVKAADYEYITVKLKIENSTDEAITLSQYGWSAKMKDGYKFKNFKLSKDFINGQIASHNFGEGEIRILAEKKLNVQNFELSYNLIDYTNAGKMIRDSLSGKSEEQCKKDYPELFEENRVTFNIEV